MEKLVEPDKKAIERITDELSAMLYMLEQKIDRIAYIDERLQGPRPKSVEECSKEPPSDYISTLNAQLKRFRVADESLESILCNIETIL